MKTRAALPAALSAVLAACAVHHRTTDPVPMDPVSENTPLPPATTKEPPEPFLAEQSTAALIAPTSSPSSRIQASIAHPAVSVPPGKPRAWGRVAITTSILSPSQLIGPEVSYSTEFRALPAFPEKLTFEMSWGLLSVGEATLSVDKIIMFNGRPAYHLVSEARSNAFCDTFYAVRDLNESWLDARTLTSLGYSKKVREGRFFRDEWVLYDRDSGVFVNRRISRDGKFSVRTGTIPAQVQDILSSIYYTRAQSLQEGAAVKVDVNTPDNWPLVIVVMKREALKVPAGRFNSVQVEPAMAREGIFVQKGKRLRLWLSDDARKTLLMMKVEIFFGNVTATLREIL